MSQPNKDCYEQDRCICCNGVELNKILDLGEQPLANSYHKPGETLPVYPLGLNLCHKCYHLQLTHIVNPDLLFKNYLYVSGTSKTLKDYFSWFAKWVEAYDPSSTRVLDIACNDGSQLDAFAELCYDTYGVDPAVNLHAISSKKHKVICDYFSAEVIEKKVNEVDRWPARFDIILAQNVFAHTKHALQFLEDCSKLMHNDSLLFIQTSQAEMVQNNEFDTIYHEHISFFNINSINHLIKRTGALNLVDVIKTPVHGVSYVFIIGKNDDINNKPTVDNLLAMEKIHGLHSLDTYKTYRETIMEMVQAFQWRIEEFQQAGYKIVGYGAAAKGNTYLNFTKVKLDIIIDDNPLKQGLLTPGTDIPIHSIDILNTPEYKDSKILFVPLAWNYYDEIRKRLTNVRNNPNDRFLKYFPQVRSEK